jgi:putative CocE/NonD family hydrolase
VVPGVAPNSFFTDWIRYDGCFALANAVRWSMSHAVCPTQPPLEHFTWDELYALGSLEQIESRAGFASPELREWVAHDRYDGYWEAIDQRRMYQRITVPGLHVGGWFDHLTRGQFQAYRGIGEQGATEEARTNQRLFIGPWGHSTIGQREYGEWDCGTAAQLDSLTYEQRFIDWWMKDIDDGISEEPPVRVFLMGEDRWIDLPDWPPPEAEQQEWHLRSHGGANGLGGDGRLSLDSPGDEPPDRYTHDPRDPVPTRGGPIYWGLSPAGPVDQRAILARGDVLYYRSGRLPHPLTVIGEVNLDLWITSGAEDTDFIAKLCVMEPAGRITSLTCGSLRCRYRESWSEPRALERKAPTRLRVNMGNLAYVFPAGSRIALIVTSSSFPRILPHPNTMAPTWQETSPQAARQEVLHMSGYTSSLLLPVVPT